jgi:predicted restriction endonuclease
MASYVVTFGHVDDIMPGTHFASRQALVDKRLHKVERDGISWGRDADDKRAAEAIVLSKGYRDDHDGWAEILYTGAGGRNDATGRQVKDQVWTNPANEAMRRSRIDGRRVRVIRGHEGEAKYSPKSGYRYDGLYRITEEREEIGKDGFKILRFTLLRLSDEVQELRPFQDQFEEVQKGVARRKTTTIDRIVRDTAAARRVKKWHNHQCQICGIPLPVGEGGATYAEGAHIQSLGANMGPDVEGNILCLCPNCHIRLDRGALYLTKDLEVIDRFPLVGAPSASRLRQVEEHMVHPSFAAEHRRFWKIETP